MYGNYSPRDEYRGEDDPHEPTNLPDDLEDEVHRVFEHTESWSVQSGHVKYVYPKTERGYDDYAYMLDEMGFEPGAIFTYRQRSGAEIRLVVTERYSATVRWGERYTVDDAAVTVELFGGDDEFEGESRQYTPGEGHSPKNLWKAYIYGALERVGHVAEA